VGLGGSSVGWGGLSLIGGIGSSPLVVDPWVGESAVCCQSLVSLPLVRRDWPTHSRASAGQRPPPGLESLIPPLRTSRRF